jgi:AcrR family transcriptional regulator
MYRKMPKHQVEPRRRYDAQGRVEQARRTRELILEVAQREFGKRGYAQTTVAMIARGAGVSVETVYKGFGGKPGLMRGIHERGLAGKGSVPAPQRSDAMSARERDPRAILRGWGALAAEVSPLVSPMMLLVREAAANDPELATLLHDSNEQRLRRMRRNAKVLADRGFLRDDVSVKHAADLMWTLTAPELYELLVVQRRWTPARFGEFIARTMIEALLPKESS